MIMMLFKTYLIERQNLPWLWEMPVMSGWS